MPARNKRLLILLILSAAIILVPAYLRAYSLSGASDAPTLLLGDTAIVNQAAYWVNFPYTQTRLVNISHPRRGDMVLLRHPEVPFPFFKRVIGLPGETIEIRDNRVIIDGRPLPWKVVSQTGFSWVPPSHHMGTAVYDEEGHQIAFTPGSGNHRNLSPTHLKNNEYFLLGDNRDNSLDCRMWGPLKEDVILGKMVLALPTGPRAK